MPLWLLFVLLVLATYRVAKFVTVDELIADWRSRFEETHDNKVGYFVGCPFCVSVWAAALLTAATWAVLQLWGDGLPLPLLVWAGAAGGASLIFDLLPE